MGTHGPGPVTLPGRQVPVALTGPSPSWCHLLFMLAPGTRRAMQLALSASVSAHLRAGLSLPGSLERLQRGSPQLTTARGQKAPRTTRAGNERASHQPGNDWPWPLATQSQGFRRLPNKRSW